MDTKVAYKFCPRCGQPTKPKRYHMQCNSCGLGTYYNPKPVTEIALRNGNGEYVFCVRAVDPNKGMLDFPGGFVDDGEDFEQAIRREVKEELGVELGEIEYLGSSKTKYLFQGVNYSVVGASYFAELPVDTNPKAHDDVAGIEFYKITNVPLERLANDSDRELVKKLAQRELRN